MKNRFLIFFALVCTFLSGKVVAQSNVVKNEAQNEIKTKEKSNSENITKTNPLELSIQNNTVEAKPSPEEQGFERYTDYKGRTVYRKEADGVILEYMPNN